MTKYTQVARRSARAEEQQVNPIWRGIGCLMMVIIPLVSYLLARFTVNTAIDQGLAVPYQLMGYPVLPPELYQTGLAPVAQFIASQQNLYGILFVMVLYIVIFGGLISFIWALLYRYLGPPRYGPLDAPTPDIKVKRYKR